MLPKELSDIIEKSNGQMSPEQFVTALRVHFPDLISPLMVQLRAEFDKLHSRLDTIEKKLKKTE